jgi:preprotein translocase SecE subunit
MSTMQEKPMTDRAPSDRPDAPDSRPEIRSLAAPAQGSFSAQVEHGKGLYKPGQGYWTRVGTAIGIALITLTCIAWAWRQAALFADKIPTPTWTLTLAGATGEAKVGERVEVAGAPAGPGQPAAVLGTAAVTQVSTGTTGRALITVGDVTFGGEASTLAPGRSIKSTSGTFLASVERAEGNPAFPLQWLQGGVAITIALVGIGLIYWLVGVRARSVDFLIATDGEMKKVNWSTRKTIVDSTWMVVFASILIAGLIYIIDVVFQWFFALVGVLDR